MSCLCALKRDAARLNVVKSPMTCKSIGRHHHGRHGSKRTAILVTRRRANVVSLTSKYPTEHGNRLEMTWRKSGTTLFLMRSGLCPRNITSCSRKLFDRPKQCACQQRASFFGAMCPEAIATKEGQASMKACGRGEGAGTPHLLFVPVFSFSLSQLCSQSRFAATLMLV